MDVITETGALDIGIASVIKKNKGKEKRLIPLLMILFAIGGTTYGMAEETIAFYPLLVFFDFEETFSSFNKIGRASCRERV